MKSRENKDNLDLEMEISRYDHVPSSDNDLYDLIYKGRHLDKERLHNLLKVNTDSYIENFYFYFTDKKGEAQSGIEGKI